MMRRFIILLLLPIFIYSCNNSGNNVIIKGKLENPKGSYIYLQEMTVEGNGPIDSLLLENSGSFKFKREIAYPSFFTLRVGKNEKLVTLLAMPGERIKIKGRADSLLHTYHVTGSEESQHVQLLSRRLDKTINSLDSLNRIYQQFLNNPNIENIRNILSMNYERVLEEQRKFSTEFVTKHPESLACLMALYQKINSQTYIFDKEEDVKYFIKADSAIFRKYRDAPYVRALHANIDQMQQQSRIIQIQQLLSIMGAKAPTITIPSLRGDSIRLSSFKGKVVLLYFWASWNEECRKENIKMIDLYNKYRTQGFEILQISLDKTKEAWAKAIAEDRLWWPQGCDFKYWQSPLVKLYNFEKVPTTFLIDRSGIIISRDLKGDDLNQKILEILEEKSTATGKQASTAGK